MEQDHNPLNQGKTNNRKLEKPLQDDRTPPVQVDSHSDPITNFVRNLKKQFKKAEGIGLWGLFKKRKPGGGQEPPDKAGSKESIIGPIKTDLKNSLLNKPTKINEPVQKNTTPTLKASVRENEKIPATKSKPKLRL